MKIYDNPATEIQKLEMQMAELNAKLETLRKESKPVEVKNYALKNSSGDVSLLDLFGDKEKLFVIHNMGKSCPFCTLLADGLNGYVPHFESQFAFVVLSKDTPAEQKAFANSRGWKFKMASHGGGEYIQDQAPNPGKDFGGVIVYERKGNKVFRKNASAFGPGDNFTAFWNLMSLSGDEFMPKFKY